MNSFELYNPTKIIFGTDAFEKIAKEIPIDKRILMTFGGGSIKENGIYSKVLDQLKHHTVLEFGGIEPNPSLQTLLNALKLIREEKIDYLFAVGGGSVIDGTKFLAAAAMYEGDPWDIPKKGLRVTKALPIACLLTLPATGTESNSGAVITNKDTGEKLGMGSPVLFPVVSFLNPEVVRSISKRQLKNGVVDAYTHVLEQYLTYPVGADLQDRFAESILNTLIELSHPLIFEPYNPKTAANFMWSCTMALNGLLNKGVPTDWATHMIGHELTALYEIDHAMTLAIIFPNLWKYKFDAKKEKLAQYAERVFGFKTGSVDEKAKLSIEKTIEWLHSIEVKTKLSEYTSSFEPSATHVKDTFEKRLWLAIGDRKDLTPADAYEIVRMSY